MADATLPMWSVHDVFVQANVVHGFRYLDLSGIVLNILSDRYRTVNVITPEGTTLSEPIDKSDPSEIQFGSTRIWLHYTGIDAIQKVEGTAPEMMKSISEKLEMKEFSRYGVRVNYFLETKNVLKAGESLTRKLISAPIGELVATRRPDIRTSLQIPLVVKDMEVIFRFRWLVITHPAVGPVDYSGDGLILDIDLGQRREESFSRHDFTSLMRRAVETHTEILTKYGQPLLKGVNI